MHTERYTGTLRILAALAFAVFTAHMAFSCGGQTETGTATVTPTATSTDTLTATNTSTGTGSATATSTGSATSTGTNTNTDTGTSSSTGTATSTNTNTNTFTGTSTATSTGSTGTGEFTVTCYAELSGYVEESSSSKHSGDMYVRNVYGENDRFGYLRVDLSDVPSDAVVAGVSFHYYVDEVTDSGTGRLSKMDQNAGSASASYILMYYMHDEISTYAVGLGVSGGAWRSFSFPANKLYTIQDSIPSGSVSLVIVFC